MRLNLDRTTYLQLALGLVSSLFAATWGYLLATTDQARWAQSYLAYYFCFGVTLLGAILLVRACRGVDWRRWLREHRWGVLLVLVLGNLLHVHEPHQMRVFQDEPGHVLMSRVMQEQRMAVLPERAFFEMGNLIHAENGPMFRMVYYAFAVSLIHDLTGFRIANAFILNYLLTFALLGLTFAVGRRLAGPTGGVFSVLLLCTLPLLAQTVTSAGYDTINLTLLAGFLLALLRYAALPGSSGLNGLVCVGLLLAFSRNESVLFLGLIPLLVLFKAWRERSVKLTWFSVAAPTLTLPSFWAYKIYASLPSIETLYERRGGGFFSNQFFERNLGETLHWMLRFDTAASNSLLISVLGGLALIMLLVVILMRLTLRRVESTEEVALAGFSVVVVALGTLYLSQFWSPADNQASRLLLPGHLTACLAVVWVFRQVRLDPLWVRRACALPALFGLLFTLPANARSFETNNSTIARYSHWAMDWFADNARPHTLIISPTPLLTILHGYPTLDNRLLRRDPERLLGLVREGYYSDILTYSIELFDPNTIAWRMPLPASPYPDRLVMETLDEVRFSFNNRAQIKRVIGVELEDGSVQKLEDIKRDPRSFNQLDEYFEYIRELFF